MHTRGSVKQQCPLESQSSIFTVGETIDELIHNRRLITLQIALLIYPRERPYTEDRFLGTLLIYSLKLISMLKSDHSGGMRAHCIYIYISLGKECSHRAHPIFQSGELSNPANLRKLRARMR